MRRAATTGSRVSPRMRRASWTIRGSPLWISGSGDSSCRNDIRIASGIGMVYGRVARRAVFARDDERVTAQRLPAAVEREAAQIGAPQPNAEFATSACRSSGADAAIAVVSSTSRSADTARDARARHRSPVLERDLVRRAPEREAERVLHFHDASLLVDPGADRARSVGRDAPCVHRVTSRDHPSASRLIEPRAVRHVNDDSASTRIGQRLSAPWRSGRSSTACTCDRPSGLLTERDRDRDHRREHDGAGQRRAACRPTSHRAR